MRTTAGDEASKSVDDTVVDETIVDDLAQPDGSAPLAKGPLAGLRVLDLGTVYAAPITAMLLADWGADVIKVEHPRGDPARHHGLDKDGFGLWWKVISRNKRTITLNFSKPEGQDILRRLADQADVVIENFRPGVMEKWGLGPEELQKINPSLIVLRVTGFGQTGPYAKRRAFGTLAEAMSGFAHLTGSPDGPPTLPPFGLADGVAGLSGAYAVMLALYNRDAKGGTGQVIDLSLLEPLVGILGPSPSVFDQLGKIPGRYGNQSRNNAPRNLYLTSDDRWVAVSGSTTSVAERVMQLVGRGDIAEEPWFPQAGERVTHSDLIDPPVAEWIRARPYEEVCAAFQEAGAALAPVYDVEQLTNDPQVQARDMITTIEDEDLGPLKMQNLFFRMDKTQGSIRHGGRRLGQDTDSVLDELLGISGEKLEALHEAGVL
jgi:crotonobetainyl-CoA:carnitine CoA-transferase CaiB-like acyl-CoA transferase